MQDIRTFVVYGDDLVAGKAKSDGRGRVTMDNSQGIGPLVDSPVNDEFAAGAGNAAILTIKHGGHKIRGFQAPQLGAAPLDDDLPANPHAKIATVSAGHATDVDVPAYISKFFI
jgi:hypothetical protein